MLDEKFELLFYLLMTSSTIGIKPDEGEVEINLPESSRYAREGWNAEVMSDASDSTVQS